MPEPLPPQEELRRLVEFVWHLQDILEVVVRRPYGILPGRHHDVLRAAWPEVSTSFDNLRNALGTQPEPVRLRLESVGLVGFRLQFELAIFDHTRARLFDHAPELFVREAPVDVPVSVVVPTIEPRPRARRPGFWRQLGRLIRGCLKGGDILLGSLAALFPPAEAITQFKEGIEEGIDLVRGEKES